MEPIVVLVIVAVLLIVVSIVMRRRRTGRQATTSTQLCVFCDRPIAITDHMAAVEGIAVRKFLGRVPTDHPPTTDPLGNLRWLAHVDCASKAGVDLRSAGKIGTTPHPPSADPKQLTCPACGHHFRRPDIVISTEEVAREYGPNAEQCPRCDHIWDPGGPPRLTMRG